ncbi:MAG: SprT family zinc-dependent metalloprotease [bacterium]|nr:SprT family zinc-dependent metalloprotease [bacterium]
MVQNGRAKKITLGSQELEYTLKISARARRLRLTVYCDGSVVATLPRRMSKNALEEFILKKAQWILRKVEYFKKFPTKVLKGSHSDFLKYREQALALARQRVEYYAARYGFVYRKINIKNQKTRWGSCSKKGNLNFNYKIALLPEALANYLVVHELCHLKEFNHSYAFWKMVGDILPDYAVSRRELKKNGMSA